MLISKLNACFRTCFPAVLNCYKMGFKKTAAVICTAIIATGALGAGNMVLGAQSGQNGVKGYILVNGGPDFRIAYDRDGDVVQISGSDEEGRKFLEGQRGYLDEDCKDAIELLVKRLDEKGWLNKGSDSSRKNLVIKAEKGSWYPDDSFMQDIEKEVRELAENRNLDIYIKVIGSGSLDDKGYISKETAEKMVLEQLGLNADSLKVKEYDLDDGVYEIEVLINGTGHEIKLNAVTGEVIAIERDNDNDGRYDDDRFDDDRYDDRWDDDDRYDDDWDDDDRYDDDWDDDDRDDDDRYDD